MSVRMSLLRDAITSLIDAAGDLPETTPEMVAASGKAILALHATRFVAPENFPCVVTTRCGTMVTLFALFDGHLIGGFRDNDGGGLDLRHWNADGTMFCRADPDAMDLMLPEDAPLPESNAHYPRNPDTVVVPILGRIS